MIDLAEHAEGLVLEVRAQPGARKNEVRGVHDGALKVSVTQVAEKGKANKAIVVVLTNALKLKRSQVTLLAGETNRQKQFLIGGIGRCELEQRLAALR